MCGLFLPPIKALPGYPSRGSFAGIWYTGWMCFGCFCRLFGSGGRMWSCCFCISWGNTARRPKIPRPVWSRNVRELENIVERVVALKQGERITPQDLKEALYPPDLEDGGALEEMGQEEPLVLSEPERLRRALEQCGGNKTRAAKLLGMDRSTLWRKLKKYQI